MTLLETQLTDPVILVLLAFAGGILAGWLARKLLDASPTMILSVMVLPSVVCAALLAINGSLGAGIAILGVFGLVRFRSLPGSGSDIVAIFYAMVIGLVMSTGFVAQAFLLTIILALVISLAVLIVKRAPERQVLHIVIPEDEGHLDRFTRIVKKNCTHVVLDKIRTTNMGSMYELVYLVDAPKDPAALLDEIRVHNHNLNVSLHTARTENVL